MTRRVAWLLLPCCAAACAVGPDFRTPKPPEVAGYTRDNVTATAAALGTPLGAPQRFAVGVDVPPDWWTAFESSALNALVRRALTANPSLEAAQAALRQARELAAAQRGGLWPSVTAGVSASRALTPTAALSPASASGNPYYSLITPQVSVSFVPDVFGANARAVEAADAQAVSQRFQLEATRLTLAANVVLGAFQAASLRDQIAAVEESVRIARDLLGVLRRQQAAGAVSGADVAGQETALAQAEQVLPPLRKQAAQQENALAVLTGGFPGQEPPEVFALARFTLPRDLPVSLPSKLVAQRPDIRQAEAVLHAASAAIGQAVAARLPQISLTASLGGSASGLAQLFAPGTNFWNLAAGATQPLFDGFALRHRERAARAAFDQAGAQYRQTVLTAFQNVADTLKALQYDAEALRAAAASERAAARGLEIVRKQLAAGQIPYAGVLAAETAWQQAHLALVQAQAARLMDTAALFQALGGGWWNRTGDAAAAR